MQMDEFSFPTPSVDTDSPGQFPYPHFAASSLWFPSSTAPELAAQPGPSALSGDATGDDLPEDGEKTASEKMDQLWEEFNEELAWLSLTQMEKEKQSAPLFWLVHSKPTKGELRALGRNNSGGGARPRSTVVVAALKLMKRVMPSPIGSSRKAMNIGEENHRKDDESTG